MSALYTLPSPRATPPAVISGLELYALDPELYSPELPFSPIGDWPSCELSMCCNA
jgi:hypothetical protein